jgi:O-6-methylguanine DNA methyltransferase
MTDGSLGPRERRGGRVRFATGRAPWGPVRIAVSDRGLVGLAVLSQLEPFVASIVRRTGLSPIDGSSHLLDRSVAAVDEFLEGRPAALGRLPLDLVVGSAWDRAVLQQVRRVGWGEATSYGRVARAIGRRGAARAVGGAVGRNPIGLAIPCHRVLAGDGSIGGYGGDWFGSRDELLEIKRELLALEGISLPARDLSGGEGEPQTLDEGG